MQPTPPVRPTPAGRPVAHLGRILPLQLRFRLGWYIPGVGVTHESPAMRRLLALSFATMIVGMCALTASSQPPPEGKHGKKGGPPGFELGKVLPPFVREELDLTDEQEKQLAALEQEVKRKLEKILTPEQQKKAASAPPADGAAAGL